MELNIVNLIEHPTLVPIIVDWIQSEWPSKRTNEEVKFRLCGTNEHKKLPFALVAVIESAPIGFVSIVFYEKGLEEQRPHWIDALYVIPSHRGKGYAHALLRAAEINARSFAIDRLFALTEISGLYQKAGWEKVEASLPSPQDTIMMKEL